MQPRRLLPVAMFVAGALVATLVGWLAFARDGGNDDVAGNATTTESAVGPTTTRRPGDNLPADAPAYELCLALQRLTQLDAQTGADVEAQRRAAWERAYQYAAGTVATDLKTIIDDLAPVMKPETFEARQRVARYYADNCPVTIDPPTTEAAQPSTSLTVPALDTLPLDPS